MDDSVDRILAQWAQARPDLDVSAMGVIGRLSRLSRLVERSLNEVFVQHDLQPGEFDILATLYRCGQRQGLTAGELATSAMVTSGAITNRLDRLVAKKLVTRDIDPASRRTIRVALTSRGHKALEDALVDHIDNEKAILATLESNDREQLQALLRKLLSAHEGD